MFKVDGVPILHDDLEVLEELRRQLLLNGQDLLRKFKRGRSNIQFCCPMHKKGQERKLSCGILTEDKRGQKAGTVNCFTCGYVATLPEMISHCFGYDDYGIFGKRWILKNFMTLSIEERKDLNLDFRRDTKPAKTSFVSEKELDSYRYTHPYLYKRGMTDELIEKFDLGYDPDFELTNEKGHIVGRMECVTFPVRNIEGKTLFVARRAIKTKFFKYPDSAEKPVYGLYELPKDASEIIVCESIFNALTCYRYGKPAVALLGLGNEYQYEQLRRLSTRKFIAAFDPDTAGAKATQRLRDALKNKIITEYEIPPNKDINELLPDEFMNLTELY